MTLRCAENAEWHEAGQATLSLSASMTQPLVVGALPRLDAFGEISSSDAPISGHFTLSLDQGVLTVTALGNGQAGFRSRLGLVAEDLLAQPSIEVDASANLPAAEQFIWTSKATARFPRARRSRRPTARPFSCSMATGRPAGGSRRTRSVFPGWPRI